MRVWGTKVSSRFKARWMSLAILVVLGTLFQNMSWVDIRDLAPEKPEGYYQDPFAEYVPSNLRARSLEEVGQGFLSHNLDPYFRQFEIRYLRMETPFFGMSLMQSENIRRGEMASVGAAGSSSRSDLGRWRLSLVSPQKMRITMLKRWLGQEYEMTWEAQAGEDGVRWALSRPLTEQVHVGVVHQTGLRHSQIQMDYSF